MQVYNYDGLKNFVSQMKAEGVCQKDIATKAGFSEALLSLVLNGQRDLSAKNIRAICSAYNLDYADIVKL